MHLADITMFHAPDSGGVRTYLQAKHRHLATLPDVAANLLVPAGERQTLGALQTLPAFRLPLGQGYRFPLRRSPWRDALVELGPDLIEAGDPYVTAWAALEAGQQLGVPVVGFYHSDLPRLMGDRFGPPVARRLKRYVADLYGRFDSVLVPCRSMGERLEDWGVQGVRVQPLGVDLDTFHPRRRQETLRETLGLDDATRLLVFAGRNSREKNINDLLATAQQLGRGYHLLLMGPGMPTQVPDNVSVISRCCSPNEVARALASADAMVHAGTRETFGLVALEAMASGLPVVAARAGALIENVPLGCGVLCEPHAPNAMARAVEELFLNDAAAIGRHARRHVERHYRWSKVIDGLLDHYRTLSPTLATMTRCQHG
ncbi:glycosyltransferase family 1 protein [Halomonas sp. I5-271120]|uniref:glycosyltransferase family 4 protein n=1 Tax=Halomonas sp. I5-271120 TaxID=3061632 RepID=UPI00271455CA|nr:glycosyltransferase family 1 protein [Halomonas sp. I5-271120]